MSISPALLASAAASNRRLQTRIDRPRRKNFVGRPRILPPNEELVAMRAAGMTLRQIAAQYGVAVGSVAHAFHRIKYGL